MLLTYACYCYIWAGTDIIGIRDEIQQFCEEILLLLDELWTMLNITKFIEDHTRKTRDMTVWNLDFINKKLKPLHCKTQEIYLKCLIIVFLEVVKKTNDSIDFHFDVVEFLLCRKCGNVHEESMMRLSAPLCLFNTNIVTWQKDYQKRPIQWFIFRCSSGWFKI